MTKTDHFEGSGNVFADLGHPNADEMLAKAELAIKITDILHRRHLTQVQAADILGIDQPKVSALIRGRIAGFSIERLLHFLLRLGADVSITIHSHRRARQYKKPAGRGSRLPKRGVLTISEIGTAEARSPRAAQIGG